MATATAAGASRPGGPTTPPGAAPPVGLDGLLDAAGMLVAQYRSMAADTLRLLGLELRASGVRIGLALALAAVAALLMAATWLAWVAAAAAGLVTLGVGWAAALALVGLANLLGAGLAALLIRTLLARADLSRSLARLAPGPDAPATVAEPARPMP